AQRRGRRRAPRRTSAPTNYAGRRAGCSVARKPKGSVTWDGRRMRWRMRVTIAGEEYDKLYADERVAQETLAALLEQESEAQIAPTTLHSFGVALLEEAERAGARHIEK